MNAKQLIRSIRNTCNENYVEPRNVKMNYRHDEDHDVFAVQSVHLDGSTIVIHRHLGGQKGLTAQSLIERIQRRIRSKGLLPENVGVTFGVGKEPIVAVEEDLFDSESNSTLESIVILSHVEEYECVCCDKTHTNEFSLTCEECDSERESGTLELPKEYRD